MKIGEIYMAFDRLVGILDECLQQYSELAELEHSKRDVIVKDRMDGLQQLNEQESTVMMRLMELDQERIEAILHLQQERGLRSDAEMTLTELIGSLAAEEERQALVIAQQVLSETTRKLRSLGERNQLLMEQSLAFVEDTVQTMVGSIEKEYVYQNPKTAQEATNRAAGFDIRT